tara:strand:- start:150 stop:377 length:228 start_codon:yes stop_codon:yes gene_type:complete
LQARLLDGLGLYGFKRWLFYNILPTNWSIKGGNFIALPNSLPKTFIFFNFKSLTLLIKKEAGFSAPNFNQSKKLQ